MSPDRIIKIVVDLGSNTLRVGAQSWTFTHHKGALFVACLIEAAHHGRALSSATLLTQWRTLDPHAAPDRSNLRRMVMAVLSVLDAVPALGAKRLRFTPRSKTVGPWQLALHTHERWRVTGKVALASNLPSLCLDTEPIQMVNIVQHIMQADDLTRMGNFEDAATYLSEHFANHAMHSAECMALVTLRQMRLARLGSNQAAAKAAAKSSLSWIHKCSPMLAPYLLAERELIDARTKYQFNPVQFSTGFNTARLEKMVTATDAPRLRAELCQLQGLVMRRRVDALVEKKSPRHQIALIAHRAIQLHEAALYWSMTTRDAYATQAGILNFAYLLQRLAQAELLDSFTPALRAYSVAFNISERFEFPDDCGWDYIMLAELWLQEPEVRRFMAHNPLLWPNGKNPAHATYYKDLVQLAKKVGNDQQIEEALMLQETFQNLPKHAR